MERRPKEDQVVFLQKIKPFLLRNHHIPPIESEEKRVVEDIKKKEGVIDELLKRIERLEKDMGQGQETGFRKTKIKDRVLAALQENKKMTAAQMGEALGLSRTRCSEYFRELMLDGKVEGVIVDRQKFYKLVRQ